jgi:hypothetical protein
MDPTPEPCPECEFRADGWHKGECVQLGPVILREGWLGYVMAMEPDPIEGTPGILVVRIQQEEWPHPIPEVEHREE